MAQVTEWQRGDACRDINEGKSIRLGEQLYVKMNKRAEPIDHIASIHICLTCLACLHMMSILHWSSLTYTEQISSS